MMAHRGPVRIQGSQKIGTGREDNKAASPVNPVQKIEVGDAQHSKSLVYDKNFLEEPRCATRHQLDVNPAG